MFRFFLKTSSWHLNGFLYGSNIGSTVGMPESTATFSVEAAGQVYNQTNEFVYLVGNVNQNADLSIEVDRRVRNAWCSFRKYTLEL